MARRTPQAGTADELIAALKQDRFVLFRQLIQPIGPAADESGYQEILVRYVEEEEKLLPPGGFFPILEGYNLMSMLDRWVVNRVIKWMLGQRKARKNWSPPRCSINLSNDSISDDGFSAFVKAQLRNSKVPPGRLSFEIPEADAEMRALALEQLIDELKPLGWSFTITGYSGDHVTAELLQALDIDFVKIDGGIVKNIHRDVASFSKARTIHRACRAIGIRTIGEFVERPETLAKLKELGVDYAQGYGISRPAPLE